MPEERAPVRVLIADDSPLICERLAEMLGVVPGVEVVGHTGDASATLQAVRDLHPDVLTLDVRMPGGGFAVLKAIRAENLPVFVIVLTNYTYPEYEKRARELQADVFLRKSDDFEKVAELVRDLTRRPASPVWTRRAAE